MPAHLYRQLVEAGAQEVSGRQLARRLAASGLRVPLKERPPKIRRNLLERWQQLAPQDRELGQQILDCWQEPSRSYHNSAHLLEMLLALESLSRRKAPRVLLLATWLHDLIYEGKPGEDEAASATFARLELPRRGLSTAGEAQAVAQLIEATADHKPRGLTPQLEAAGLRREDIEIFLDADLSILAAPTARYNRYAAGIREEYAHLADADFIRGRRAVLTGLLERETIYLSAAAQQRWEQAARANLSSELA